MVTYITRRLLLMIPTLVGITFLVFLIAALSPGGIGAVLQAEDAGVRSQQSLAVMRASLEDRYGLDAPVLVQYGRWLGRISPIRIGERDQVAPSGERAGIPRPLAEPPLWRWFADSLPPAREAVNAHESGDHRERYRAAERAHAEARQAAIATSIRLRAALADYARAAGWPELVDAEGRPRLGALADREPDKSRQEWPALERSGHAAIRAWSDARAAHGALETAFRARPFPEAGVPIIPGVLSLAPPDFGVACSTGRPVSDLVARALPTTLLLNLLAFPIIYAVAIPGGVLAAIRRGTWLDTGLGALFTALWSVPVILAGVFAIGVLASPDSLGAFPISGLHANAAGQWRFLPSWNPDFQRGWLLDSLWHLCLPVLCLVYGGFALLSRQTRAAMLENLSADYIRTARAKGAPASDVVLHHALRNSLLPLITIFVTIFPAMLSGSVVVERIFSVPGMGTLIFQAINQRDRELLMACTLVIAGVNLLAMLLADVLYAAADPRISYE